MLSHIQFFQLKKLLEGNMREVECPCGVQFYTFSPRAVYHNNACRQKFFRTKQVEVTKVVPMTEVQDEVEQELPEQENETLKQLIEKGKNYTNKLKTIQNDR